MCSFQPHECQLMCAILLLNSDKAAEQLLTELQDRNYVEFIVAMAVELATEGKDLRARQLAGLWLKNELVAKDDALQTRKHEHWKTLPDETRAPVKHALLQALQSPESIARQTGAQAAAEVAAIELPFHVWPEFLPCLLEYVSSESYGEGVKVASLSCLGFTCQRLADLENLPAIAVTTTDAMLTAIVNGIQKTRPDNIRLAAAVALKNSLLFTQKNMEQKVERDAIMNNVCEATQCQDARVRAEAFMCLQQIAFQYYDKLQEYMMTLFDLTTKAIKGDEDEVAKQAIEFWSTLCEVEMELMDEFSDALQVGTDAENTCQRYVAAAVEHLVPLLLEAMTKQDEDIDLDGDQYSLYIAASTCLTLVSQTVEDLVTPAVLPFVNEHIQSGNWHYREAATMAFACILEGASEESISGVVNQSIPVLLSALGYPNILVKDSTAFVLSKICELHARAIPQETFPTLVNGLLSKLNSEPPRVASQACNALNKLGAAFDADSDAEARGTNALSPFLPNLLSELMRAADRPDAIEHNLRVTAFESINVFVQNSAPDTKPILLQLLPVAIERLRSSFTQHVLTAEEHETKEGLQGLLCALIQVLVQKMSEEEVAPHADLIMQNLLQVLQAKSTSCHTEAFAAVSAIAVSMGEAFEKYMVALMPFLLVGLRTFEAFHVCNIAVGLVGDICRSLEGKIEPYTKEIMGALVDSLKDTSLHRSVKPPVLSCFGDIALAIGARYEPYLQFSMMLLMQASGTTAADDDDDMIEYVNTLRECVLEAYTGIIQGLKDGNRVDLFVPYVQPVAQFLQLISSDPNRDDLVLAKAAGLIGDLASSMGHGIKDQLNQAFVKQLLQDANATGDDSTMETAQWAMAEVTRLLQ